MGEAYRCETCGGEFETEDDWGTDEAREEFEALFPGEDIGNVVVVCEDCWTVLMARAGRGAIACARLLVFEGEPLGVRAATADELREAETYVSVQAMQMAAAVLRGRQ